LAAGCTRGRAGGHGDHKGVETRVRKLCYRSVNASEKLQLPPRDVGRTGRFTKALAPPRRGFS
jgi:hypothetical protein